MQRYVISPDLEGAWKWMLMSWSRVTHFDSSIVLTFEIIKASFSRARSAHGSGRVDILLEENCDRRLVNDNTHFVEFKYHSLDVSGTLP
jgi:hypothetical protein